MTFPDRRLERPLEPPEAPRENTQDVIPATERSQDPEPSVINELATESARPLTDEERKAADRDTPVGERVYAPASERVAKTVPDYRDVVEHVDTHTPEREAVAQTGATTGTATMTDTSSAMPGPSTTGSSYTSPSYSSAWTPPEESGGGFSFMRMGMIVPVIGAAVGLFLFMRWRRERNKPINRMRRTAKRAASQLRERMPDVDFDFPEEAARPTIGAGTALLSLALLLWRQSQQRSASDMESRTRDVRRRADKMTRKAGHVVAETDWQDRLGALKERWTPNRIELEKVSIPRR